MGKKEKPETPDFTDKNVINETRGIRTPDNLIKSYMAQVKCSFLGFPGRVLTFYHMSDFL